MSALDFKSFTASKKRRSNRPLDAIRRRRWIRTRVQKAPAEVAVQADSLKPHIVCWDVQVDDSGSKSIVVRSNLQVSSSLEFQLRCCGVSFCDILSTFQVLFTFSNCYRSRMSCRTV